MAQVKKKKVRDAILRNAFDLFSENGYSGTTLHSIARRSGISTSTIYVYFSSKLEILLTIMRPWLLERFDELEMELRRIPDQRERIRRFFTVLWGELPAADNNFAVNLVQGLALAGPQDTYSRDVLRYLETRVTRMLHDNLGPEQRQRLGNRDDLAHLVMMAFDGFVANERVHGRSQRLDSIVEIVTDMLLGPQEASVAMRATRP